MKTSKKSKHRSGSSSSGDSNTSVKDDNKSHENARGRKRKDINAEELPKREDRDEHLKNKKSRNDNKDDHRNKESQEHSKKEKYNDRNVQPERSKQGDTYRDRRRSDEKDRYESDRYKRHRDDKEERGHYENNKYHRYSDSRDKIRDREERFASRDDNRHRNPNGDRRRDDKYSRNRRNRSRSGSFDHTNAKWGKSNEDKKGKPADKEKPNFGLSGKLAEETNTYRGVVIKYSEPPEARKPKRRWRLYPFKGEKALQTLYIHRESAYLIGRDRKVVDLPVDHPSCSKQHAVLQYRLVPFKREDGSEGKRVRPYIIDLDSANGTFINNKKIEPKKFVELLEKDVIKFGFSSREYVLLHENSKDEAQDDDVKQEEEEQVTVKGEPEN